MLTIGDKEYPIEDLNDETKVRLGRVEQLRAELSSTQLRASELEVLINIYTNTIRETLAPSDSPE